MATYELLSGVPESIFRAYDIRCSSDDLTDNVAYSIGLAIAYKLQQLGETHCLVARDIRQSSPRLHAALSSALCDAGLQVIDLGILPTPLLYFAAATGDVTSGVMITASHNPSIFNGFKLLFKGQSPTAEDINTLYQLIHSAQLELSHSRMGHISSVGSTIVRYIDFIKQQINLLKPLKVVLDCSSSVGALVAPALLRYLGCEVVELNTALDSEFSQHLPDTSQPAAYRQLQQKVIDTQADLGLILDGDADRIGMVDNRGHIIWPDRLLMLMAQDVLKRQPGSTIIYDVKSTEHLKAVITAAGGKPLMWRTGHSFMKRIIHETQAPVGAEMSGHFFFNERWFGFDDGIYAAVRLLEVISQQDKTVATLFATLPHSVATPEILYPVADADKFHLIERLQQGDYFPEALSIDKTDGLRITFEHGWGLIRASNTTANLTLRFESDTREQLKAIQRTVMSALSKL